MNKIFIIFSILFFNLAFANSQIVEDEFVKDLIPEEKIENKYNFENTQKTFINIRFLEPIKSEKELFEGQIIDLIVDNNVFIKKELLVKRNTKIKAKVNTIITSGMNGIPASIILSDFEIPNIKKENLSPTLEIFGQDRSLLVFPLKWALTPLPPTGSLTNFIKGGKVKIKTNKVYTIYYYPD